jgi:hypothetical protein
MNEDQNRAAFFNSRYDELKRKRPALITKIKDVYGIIPQEEEAEETTEPDDFTYPAITTIDGGEW